MLSIILSIIFSSFVFAQINDTEAPTKPTYLKLSNITQTTIDLEWSQSTYNVGVLSYNIYEKSVLMFSTVGQTLTATVSGLTAFSWYNFSVSSSDAAGNESEQRFAFGCLRTDANCGIANYWNGNSLRWANDRQNWSEATIPYECHDVVIDNGATVTTANDVPSSS